MLNLLFAFDQFHTSFKLSIALTFINIWYFDIVQRNRSMHTNVRGKYTKKERHFVP